MLAPGTDAVRIGSLGGPSVGTAVAVDVATVEDEPMAGVLTTVCALRLPSSYYPLSLRPNQTFSLQG